MQKLFTYRITEAEKLFLKRGMRVAVEFGKSKIYTGLVYEVHNQPPTAYEAKDIHQILDEFPIVTEHQLNHWKWVSDYYMCSLGEVYRASLPSAFLLESESEVHLLLRDFDDTALSNDEFLIFEALQHQSRLSIAKISEILGKKSVLSVVKGMIDKGIIEIKEQIYEQYKPKLVKYVHLNPEYNSPNRLEALLESLKRANKQRDVLMSYFQLSGSNAPVKLNELKEFSKCSSAVVKSLIDKHIFIVDHIQVDRINFEASEGRLKTLSSEQKGVLFEIKSAFDEKKVTLLKGVTSSGKTEIYVHLIQEALEKGKQVLYLLPEIALTTQLIERLKRYFGEYLSVYHSKYSLNERVEVWRNVLESKEKAQLILGARSSLLLPFSNLGLIVVDEEHEISFKQYDPAPRYHARDAAIVLANLHTSNVLMGSATPSIESYFNAKNGKYAFVELQSRFGNVLLPEVELVNLKEKYRKKRMKGHFSDRLIEMIHDALEDNEQVILFQNRRGFAPIVECTTCGVSPQCPHCDVSLTYHSFRNELKCHYCGYKQAMMHNCLACGSEHLDSKGFGTEQIELELKELFPNAKVDRMDLDTTRGKHSYQKIIGKFQSHEIDILVGTQMLSKGLDFSNVSLVGIMNADNMLNFPDFRAHERSYQLMVQVSGRAGRAHKRGRVAIQTFNPYHQILQQVSTNSYEQMYKEQTDDRYQYHYPPFFRLIKITLRHKDFNRVEDGARWLGKSLERGFPNHVLGPTTPSVGRIRNLYIRTLIVKIPQKQSLQATKSYIQKVKNTFQSVKEYRAIKFSIDVDNY